MAQKDQVIAGYTLGQPLGRGALGPAYDAVNPRSGFRAVVRIVSPSLHPDPAALENLFAGLREANQLPASATARYPDFGALPSGDVYVISEHLNGEPLPEHVGRVGTLAPEEAMVLTLDAAATLALSQHKKLFHVGLKPGKLMVMPHPGAILGGRRIVIRDFGYPRTGPEVGDSKLDVLRLGNCLYLMLMGRPPVLVQRQAMAELQQRRAGLPPMLLSLIGIMLTADDNQRPSFSQVVERLRNMLPAASSPSPSASSVSSSAPPAARPAPPPSRPASRLLPALLGVAAGATVTAGALLGPRLISGMGSGAAAGSRLLLSPSTMELCHGAVVPPVRSAAAVPASLAPLAARLNLAYWVGECYQPAYLGSRDIVYGASVPLGAAVEPAGIAHQAEGPVVVSAGAAPAGGGLRVLLASASTAEDVIRLARLPAFGSTEVSAGPVAVDGQGNYLFAVRGGGRQVLLGTRSGASAAQRYYDLPPQVAGLRVPLFDREHLFVAAGAAIARYPLVAGPPTSSPWFALEGAALRGALLVSPDRVIVSLPVPGVIGPGAPDRVATLLFDRQARGYYLLAEEDLGLLSQSADGGLWRYDSDSRTLRSFRVSGR